MGRTLAITIGLTLLAGGSAACGGLTPAPEPLAALVTDGYVSADDGVRLYYRSLGQGDDVLVVPAGLFLEEALAPLASGRRVVFYDPRNRGRSEAADLATVSLDRQIADLDALRRELGFDRMALLGWSGLGMETAVYALRHPERVTRLVQVAAVPPAAALMAASGDRRERQVDQAAIDELDRQASEGAFADRPAEYCARRTALTRPASFVDPALAARVPDVCAHRNEWPENLWPYFEALLGSFGDYDWRDELRELSVPRLVIHGREDGIAVESAYAWARGYPHARLLVLSPAGHYPFLEQPEAFFRAVETFLDGAWPEGAVAVPE